MSAAPSARLLGLVALGGALGAVLRWALGELFPAQAGFPWTTFSINVTGSLLLALLPAWSLVRRHQEVALGLGPGLLGGFTTLSACSEETRVLLADGRPALAAAYLLGTLAAAVVAVAVADLWSSPQERETFDDEEGNE